MLEQISETDLHNQISQWLSVVLQRKPFAFQLIFFWANSGLFTFSSKTCSIVPTSNLCRNVQRPNNLLNQ